MLVPTHECGLTIATVHLESLEESAPVRLVQLERIADALAPCPDVVLRWQPEHIERLGLEPLSDDPLTFPSDHFGLVARLSRSRSHQP